MYKVFTLSLATLALAAMAVKAAPPASTQVEQKIHVAMAGTQEVPPNTSKGTGIADFTFDPASNQLSWSISTKDLSSTAVAAHVHGPAAPGTNAGVVVNLAPNGFANPLIGSATLTPAQAADLLAGKDYVNVHTSSTPGGEIRGQITP